MTHADNILPTTIVAPASYSRGPAPVDPSRIDPSQFFGPPINQAAVNPYDRSPITALNLAQAYTGQNIFLREMFTDTIHQKERGPLSTVVLPLYDYKYMQWVVNMKRFNPALATLVPYEGPSRLLTTSVESFAGKTERRGVAIKLEADFYKSGKEGVQAFLDGIQQIRDTVRRTIDLDIAMEIDSCQDLMAASQAIHGTLRLTAKDLLEFEASTFGICHTVSSTEAFGILIDKLRTSMTTFGGATPDVALLPPRFVSLFRDHARVPTKYEVINPETKVSEVRPGPDAIAQLGDVRVFVTEPIRGDEELPPYNPMSHVAQIGQYYLMHNRIPVSDMDDYDTITQTTFVHDEAKDDYVPLTPAQAYRYSCRWDVEHTGLRQEHYELVDSINGDPPAPDKIQRAWKAANNVSLDPFIFYNARNSRWDVVDLFGQMDPTFLTPAVMSAVAESLVAKMSKRGIKIKRADAQLVALRDLLRASNKEQATRAYMLRFMLCNRRYAGKYERAPGVTETNPHMPESLNECGGMDIPSDAFPEALGNMGGVPPFVNTYGMLRTLAALTASKQWGEAAGIASRGCAAIDAIASVVRTVLPDSKLNKVESLPEWQQAFFANGRIQPEDVTRWAVFNILFGAALPVFMKIQSSDVGQQRGGMSTALAAKLNGVMAGNSLLGPLAIWKTDETTVPDGLELNEERAAAVTAFAPYILDHLRLAERLMEDIVPKDAETRRLFTKELMHTAARLATRRYFAAPIMAAASSTAVAAASGNDLNLAMRFLKEWFETHYPERVLSKTKPEAVKKEFLNLCTEAYNTLRTQDGIDRNAFLLDTYATLTTDERLALAANDGPTWNNVYRRLGAPIQQAMGHVRQVATVIQNGYAIVTGGQPMPLDNIFTVNWNPNVPGGTAVEVTKMASDYKTFAASIVGHITSNLKHDDDTPYFVYGNYNWTRADGNRDPVRLVDIINFAAGADETIFPPTWATPRNTTFNNPTGQVRSQIPGSADVPVLQVYQNQSIEWSDIPEPVRKLFSDLAREGLITTSTTLAELYNASREEAVHAPVLLEADYPGLRFFNVPFGCTTALASAFDSDATLFATYGKMVLVFPPDPSTFTAPAPPGMVDVARYRQMIGQQLTLGRTAGQAQQFGMTGRHAQQQSYAQRAAPAAAPAMWADPALDETVGGMLDRYTTGWAASDTRRALATAFGLTSLRDWKTIQSMLSNNVLLPFSIVLARPWLTFRTCDIVLMKAGIDTGRTFMGLENCAMGMDANLGFWIVNYHYHAKAFIYRPLNVIKARNAVIERVEYGFGTRFVRDERDAPSYGKDVRDVHDVISMICGFYDAQTEPSSDPMSNAKGLPNPLPLTGFYDTLPEEYRPSMSDDCQFGPGCYYSFVFRDSFRKRSDIARPGTTNGYNTLCYLGEHYYYDPGARNFESYTNNTGHLHITATMPGTAKVRNGTIPTYASQYVPRTGLGV